jgi:hypothetical protein
LFGPMKEQLGRHKCKKWTKMQCPDLAMQTAYFLLCCQHQCLATAAAKLCHCRGTIYWKWVTDWWLWHVCVLCKNVQVKLEAASYAHFRL